MLSYQDQSRENLWELNSFLTIAPTPSRPSTPHRSQTPEKSWVLFLELSNTLGMAPPSPLQSNQLRKVLTDSKVSPLGMYWMHRQTNLSAWRILARLWTMMEAAISRGASRLIRWTFRPCLRLPRSDQAQLLKPHSSPKKKICSWGSMSIW